MRAQPKSAEQRIAESKATLWGIAEDEAE